MTGLLRDSHSAYNKNIVIAMVISQFNAAKVAGRLCSCRPDLIMMLKEGIAQLRASF